ncbi:cytoskeleton-associated protein 2 [Austrofundulus limnaeus]|uniref:Cytoskeleton-associated protein 2 n=1 Tax=Austrofundulus limnaeus TaxID=52670 RepID=A0A2I4B6M1_AUSLI|nr:PREDICTED: cytoskeleton-associated protein 2-like [Austrofundulus limnaeus]
MESAAISRRQHTNKRGNKENTLPAHGPKSLIQRDQTSAVPFQLQGNKKEITTKPQSLPAKPKKVDSKPVLGDAQKKVTTVQRGVKATTPDVQRPTCGQEQAVVVRKTTAEALKALPAAPSSKSAPGMYRGKIIQSKIGSIWKSSDTVGTLKSSVPRSDGQRHENVSKKNGFQSVAVPKTSKSVFDKPAQVTKASASTSRPAGFSSHRPLTRTISAPVRSAGSRNTTVVPNPNTKPKIPVTDKVNKPAAFSSLSQYRLTMETAEERRAKLAEWKASKGKTLKRPAMTAAAPSNKVPAKGKVEVQSLVEPLIAAEPSLQADTLQAAAAAAGTQGEDLTHGQTPELMNTTLDLLENSALDLSADPQDRVDDIVMNLCDALESLVTPSRCSDELQQVNEDCDDAENKPECSQMVENERMKAEEVKKEIDQEEESVDVRKATPDMKDASVIKYSVKTTPYLQSVKKTINEEVSTSKTRRSIKDVKFLTPVRRSCRIQRKSSCLPSMLVDHDPCVSSLAELVQLNEDDANAYIYRKNPALLQELPDQGRP